MAVDANGDVSPLVGAPDVDSGSAEHLERRRAWVTEVVALPDADDSHLRRPYGERIGCKAVRATVMRHFQDLNRNKPPGLVHLALCVTLRVARENGVERPARELQYHARIVRLEILASIG
jgi:hypothetical protein